MRTVLYARVSTQEQAREGVSLESQEQLARDRCKASGWELAAIYQDVMSGRKDDRPALKRLLEDASAGRFDVVVVYRLDRLGRSLVRTFQVAGELTDHGVRLISLTQPFEIDGPLGRLLLAIYASFAEMESEAIGARIRDARRHRVLTEGKHYAVPPFGYRREAGRLVVVPEAAAHVRWAFEQVAAGRGFRSIVVDLNERGVRTGTGRLWTIAGLRVVLSNPAYLGKITHGRKPARRTSKGQIRRSVLSEGEYLTAQGDHEAIVPEEQWRAAQHQLAARKGTAPRAAGAGDRYPWIAVARCGVCGSRLGTHKTRGYVSLTCGRISHSGPGACSLPGISMRLLSGALVRAMAPVLAEGVSSARRSRKGSGPAPDRTKAIAKLEAAIQREANLYRMEAQGADVTERRIRDFRAQIEALSAASDVVAIEPPKIDDFEGLWRGLDAEARAALVRSLVELVVVERDTIALSWRPEFAPYLGDGITVERPRLRGAAASAFAID